MLKLLLIIAVIAAGWLFAMGFMTGKPLQGMVHVPEAKTLVLVSRARPAVYFVPAPDMTGRETGWRTVSLKSRTSVEGDARLSMAIYDNGTGMLVTALAEARDKWEWEAAHHTPFPAIYTHIEPFPYESGGSDLPEQLHESVYVLDAGHNPFATVATDQRASHLVYRAKSVMFFNQMQVLYEYHEPIKAGMARDMRTDSPLFDPFLQRARQACSLRFPSREQAKALADGIQHLEPAADVFTRTKLARWLGELNQIDHH